MTRTIRFAFGLLLVLFGAGAIVMGVLSWIDPAGAGATNDSDPWTPATLGGSAIVVLIGALCVTLGAYVFRWRRRGD